jgi:hypothetical protein
MVSPDGWVVTAAHVMRGADGKPLSDLRMAMLWGETAKNVDHEDMLFHPVLDCLLPDVDFALLKVDFAKNADKAWMKGRDTFFHVNVSTVPLDDGSPVYSYGFPLSQHSNFEQSTEGDTKTVKVALSKPHRTTSAIISSRLRRMKADGSDYETTGYEMDKALNYGNSGGPIISTETGDVHAFCSRFVPVTILQTHLRDASNNPLPIVIPSLYCQVTSLSHPEILAELRKRNVPVKD